MNIIAVDDERAALWSLEKAINQTVKDATVTGFCSSHEALHYAAEHKVDIAFLDIEMGEMNGLFVAKRLKEIYHQTNIIFVTGYSSYAKNAFELHASGYILKPIDSEQVEKELANLRHSVVPLNVGIRVQCFGNFEIFSEGKQIFFKRPKSKEALAFLIDRRGSYISKRELAAILWEDELYTRSIQSHLHILLSEMEQALKEAGAEEIIMKRRGLYAVDVNKIDCDYYNYQKGIAAAVNSYRGEYMANYSWAEFTTGVLSREK